MEKRKKNIIIVLGTLIVLMVALTATSLAFWQKTEIQANPNVITSGCLTTNFVENSQSINLTNSYPMTDDQGLGTPGYSFSISNNCSLSNKYYLIIKVPNSQGISASNMKINIQGEKNETRILTLYNTLAGYSSDATAYVVNVGFLPANSNLDNYIIRMWIGDFAGNDVADKSFSADIEILSLATNVTNEAYTLKDYIFKNSTSNYVDYNNDRYNYAGDVSNNYVSFANKLWRIVSVKNDGVAKLILVDSSMASPYNSGSPYTGPLYMLNYNSSTIKTFLDTWFENNLINYKQYIYDEPFCNEELDSNSYVCTNKDNSYTIDDKINGNGLLTYPIGLLTYNEFINAAKGPGNYLYSSDSYWTITPYGTANVRLSSGYAYPTATYMVRPVINLNPDLLFTGNGSGGGGGADPYVLLTN